MLKLSTVSIISTYVNLCWFSTIVQGTPIVQSVVAYRHVWTVLLSPSRCSNFREYFFLIWSINIHMFYFLFLLLSLSPVKRICVFEHSVMTNFNCACPAIQRGQGSGLLSEGSSWLTACMSEQRRFWRDCADAQAAQARLNLRCSHRL